MVGRSAMLQDQSIAAVMINMNQDQYTFSKALIFLYINPIPLPVKHPLARMAKNSFLLIRAFILSSALFAAISAQSFSTDVDVSGNANVQEDGNQLQLTLDPSGGSQVQSKQQYLYGRFDMQIKAVPGYSAGTVSSFFVRLFPYFKLTHDYSP